MKDTTILTTAGYSHFAKKYEQENSDTQYCTYHFNKTTIIEEIELVSDLNRFVQWFFHERIITA